MQVSAINNVNVYERKQNPNFKSAIPAVFWEKSQKGVNLIIDLKLIERLGKILTRRANGTGSKSKEAMAERKMVMDLLYEKDRDYKFAFDKWHIPKKMTLFKSIAGFFQPKKERTGWLYGKFRPRTMLMTAEDHLTLKGLGEDIGIASKNPDKSKVEAAKAQYMKKGEDLVAIPTKEELHVIVEKIKNGGYKILKLDMYPPEGPESPFAIMGYYT